MWSPDIESTYRNQVLTATKQAQDNFSVVIDRAPAAAMNMPGAQDQITQSKQFIEQAIQTVGRVGNEVAKRIDDIVASKANLRDTIHTKKDDADKLKRELFEARNLNAIRKEQAAELKKKYSSNYHTSWLGLWRPLADQSVLGLVVAAVLFGIIAMLSVGLLIYLGGSKSPVNPLVELNQFGGFFKRK